MRFNSGLNNRAILTPILAVLHSVHLPDVPVIVPKSELQFRVELPTDFISNPDCHTISSSPRHAYDGAKERASILG